MDKVENLECLSQGYGILEEWVTDSVTQSLGPLFHGKVSMYVKYDPNPSILSQDIGWTPFAHFQKMT